LWFCAIWFVVPYFSNFWILCTLENFSLWLVFDIFTFFREILVLVAFCSVLSAGLARTKLVAKTRRAKTPLFAHTQTSDHPQITPQHYTPPSHPATPYQLRPAPTS